MNDQSHLKHSGTTRDGGNSRARGPSYDNTPHDRTPRSPNYRGQQIYTFSPMDRMLESDTSSQDLSSVRRTLIEKSDTPQLVESQVRTPRRYGSKTQVFDSRMSEVSQDSKKHHIIDKLRQMGENIEYLMRRTNTHSEDLQERLLHLKALIQDIFEQVSSEIEDLKIENSELRRNHEIQDTREFQRLQDEYSRRIHRLEGEREQLQATIHQMNVSVDRGRNAQEQLNKKRNELEKLNSMLDRMEEERESNFETIHRMKEKLEDLNNEKNQYLKKVTSQDNLLNGIKNEASVAMQNGKRLEKRVKQADNRIMDMEDHLSALQRKNKELNVQINAVNEEKNRIQQRSKQDVEQLMRLRETNKEISAKLEGALQRLKEQVRMKEDYEVQLGQLRQAVDTERRKSEAVKADADGKIKDEREKTNRRMDEYEGKLGSAEKRIRQFQKISEAADQAVNALKEELNNERRRSIALDKNYQQYQKEMARQKKAWMDKVEQEKAVNRKIGNQLKDYNEQLQKSENMLKEFARQSDVYEQEIHSLRGAIEGERRKSLMVEQESSRKIKALVDQNNGLNKKLADDQQIQVRLGDRMKQYESKYKDFERRYQDESRKSEGYNARINEIMGELDKERRMSMMNVKEKQEVIKALEKQNGKLANQIDKEAEAFKKKQAQFFSHNQDLQRVLQQTSRKSDLLSKEMLALKEQYDRERRKSLAYEQNEAKLTERMKQLSEKYSNVAARLEENKDKYIKKEQLCNILEGKYKEIERAFLEQTRKSQLNEQEIRMLHAEIEGERRKSSALADDATNKIKGLLDKNNDLSEKLNKDKDKHEKNLALIRQFEDRAKQYEGRYSEMARKSDMYEGEIVRMREEAEKDRRRSMVLDEDQKARIKALEEKNSKILQKLEEDRDRFSRTAENLKQTEQKYKLIEKLLDDERRASMLNIEEIKRLGMEMEGERRKSLASEHDHKKKLQQLSAERSRIAAQAEDLKERLSERSKTINSLETKASRAEQQAMQLNETLKQLIRDRERNEQQLHYLSEEKRERENELRKERDMKESVARQLRSSKEALNEMQNTHSRLVNTIQLLEQEAQKKDRNLNEATERSRYLAEVLNDMKAAQQKLNTRINELYNINVENAAMFEKNYVALKREIDHRNSNIEEKERRIDMLEDQVVSDSKRVIAILPNSRSNEVFLNPEKSRRI